MSQNLEKTYNPKEIEPKLYDKWCEKKYFHAEVDRSRKPFTTVMPPPNITGKLHMGHALDNTLQDILIRYKRMQGYNALWIPGTDHAAISTEVKVTNQLKEEGIDKKELGREKFLERTWQWKEEYAGTIEAQLKKLGVSCDWDRERFTMDEGCSKAVEEVFISLYEKGYIYKGSRIINWCPVCKTSLSDAEVEHEEQEGHFWHIKYPIVGTDDYLEIATTRPETMLGDTAIAVHPDDERYKDLVGKKCLLPLTDREIPIVADYYVDKEFGTGAVKITPAHDPNDFEVGKRHNLPEINIMNDDATINEQYGGKYAGMDRYEARKAMVKDLEEQGYLVKVEPHSHNVGTHDRCHTTVEPLIKQQWFVKMDELAKPAIEAVKNGDLKFVPERFDKIYLHWLENIRDWCISRQIWWGHRIPAYYCDECGEVVVSRGMPEKCPKCGCTHFTQDEDTLDTWFSSALWPFSTLGWPDKTEDLDYFYPTDVLVTGYDIIFFWVIRMVFSGYAHTGKCPFHTVFIHGLVRDSQGRKMSKSLGNGIDPLEIIDQYGADALRMTLVTGNAPGNDMRFYNERVEASRNFANKVWNASRFILMNMEDKEITEPELFKLLPADRWILSKCNKLIREVTENMDKFELGIALQKVYDFIWDEFCDWYIEFVKQRMYNAKEDPESANKALWTLREVLKNALKLLHPFMPFVTEEIYSKLIPQEESLMMSDWPQYKKEWEFPHAENVVEHLKLLASGVRNIRAEMNVPAGRKIKIYVVSQEQELLTGFQMLKDAVLRLANASDFILQQDKTGIAEDAISVVVPDATAYLPLEDMIDFDQEIERLTKEEARLTKEIARSNGMLSNEKFVSKAPAAKVQEEREKLEKYEQMMAQVKDRLASLKEKMSR
ncbi:valine--tRNA ligase [Faecalicatena contorta]|uniref:valine--tRNA ligase n=1 Tax=Faecalicatena contorta TaxID=39482 RepID=UPI00195FF425|nr:valine--tRNA ligase [Faecalicatena contorta]MBM6684561.1 valine--tRNA ligase [Faecalicatena contorta]MBM6709895.1 valine--tRNA ligase [Faecalicatena contorta]HIX99319.1 valine--tRNA ligase [Candidatus Dorea intestinigallinarum]